MQQITTCKLLPAQMAQTELVPFKFHSGTGTTGTPPFRGVPCVPLGSNATGKIMQATTTGKVLQRGVAMKKNPKGRRVGENHQFAILTNGEVELLRRLREEEGKTYQWLAEKFEVAKATVAAICKYRRR